MRILVAGAGVIGTVYGAHLGASGHAISVLSHPPRTADIAARGLTARDVLTGGRIETSAVVAPDAAGDRYDLVLVAVRADQLASACAELTPLRGAPAVLFFGNNPGGRAAIPATVPGAVLLGFPGVGGVLRDGTADYARIRQQPTALPAGRDPRLAELQGTLRQRGFAVQRVPDMDGWLAYHAAFVACVTAALYRCGGDPARLAADRPALTLTCDAVTEARPRDVSPSARPPRPPSQGPWSSWRAAEGHIAIRRLPVCRSYWRLKGPMPCVRSEPGYYGEFGSAAGGTPNATASKPAGGH